MPEPRRAWLIAPCFLLAASQVLGAQQTGWAEADAILARIHAPRFPTREFDVRAYGAVSDGSTDATQAFRQAIDAASAAGGGRVVVSPGVFVTGAIRLRSNVELHVSEGATIRFSQDPAAYLPVVLTRYEGVECWNYSPLIYAYGEKNVAVTGSGILEGGADDSHWWPWKAHTRGRPGQKSDREELFEASDKNVPVAERRFGAGHYLRPSFIETYRCQNVLIEGVTLKDSPMWFLHPVLCVNVTIRGVKTIATGPNTDGCNPESCRDVLIEDCFFSNGDDCIALKSGRNGDGRRLATPIENVVIRRCQMKNGHGGITVGSEVSGGARNIFAENCTMSSPSLDRGLRIKTNSVRGGVIEKLFFRNITLGEVAEAAMRIDMFYEEGDAGRHIPVVRDIDVRNLRSSKSRYALYLTGYEHSPIHDLRLTDCAFDGVAEGNIMRGVTALSLANVTVNGRQMQASQPSSDPARRWSVRMADAVMTRAPDPLTIDGAAAASWNYTQGLTLHALWETWSRTSDPKYRDYVRRYYDALLGKDGDIRGYRQEELSLDRVNPGRALLALFELTKEPSYRQAIERLRQQLREQPRTSDGGYWHKLIYPHQMWLDGIYMASPFLARYGQTFDEPAALDDAARQCLLIEQHTRDAKTGLLYHGWDESHEQRWCDPETGRSRQFWGRAMGWYAMGLVDVLEILPASHARRPELIATLKRLAEAIVKVQDPFDGVWYQVLDQAGRPGNYQESSVSCMFTYALLKGARHGWLGASHLAAARKAYDGILDRFVEVDAQGRPSIKQVCIVAGLGGHPYRDGSYEYYVGAPVGANDPKAVGPFVLASLEIEAQER